MRRLGALLLSAGMLTIAAAAPSAVADTFEPTRFDDPTPNGCKANNCSLREALVDANIADGRDVVRLDGGTYELSISEDEAPLPFFGGGLDLIDDVRIEGEGSRETRIDANGIDRVLELGEGPVEAPQKARLTGLTLKGGDPGAAGGSDGGGIYNEAIFLTLVDVVVRDNDAAFGGGIHHRGSFLTIKRSTIRGNNAGEGGGIHTISQDGGGPESDIYESTISGNLANKGGGILADGAPVFGASDPDLQVVNSTIAGNETSAEGGGVMSDNGASVDIRNSTIAYNVADNDNAGGGVGGGIRQFNGTLGIDDSIVAANDVGSSGSNPDCAVLTGIFGEGSVTTAPPADCTGLAPGPNLFVGSALIGPLAANGGPTRTIALNTTSPALGFANDCPETDQRGEDRPNNCDSGSYERRGP